MAGGIVIESMFHGGDCCATQTTECGSKRSWGICLVVCASLQ
jgi:hypothetical protein